MRCFMAVADPEASEDQEPGLSPCRLWVACLLAIEVSRTPNPQSSIRMIRTAPPDNETLRDLLEDVVHDVLFRPDAEVDRFGDVDLLATIQIDGARGVIPRATRPDAFGMTAQVASVMA
ncbi:hypothetical protein P12x_000226 [Tundrisphaera lichenicola]|uniref:hypothetical protein n=1 Tax=Tundrisphaera lichenicola TaxID=2029860 RepID=UPI003EB74592